MLDVVDAPCPLPGARRRKMYGDGVKHALRAWPRAEHVATVHGCRPAVQVEFDSTTWAQLSSVQEVRKQGKVQG